MPMDCNIVSIASIYTIIILYGSKGSQKCMQDVNYRAQNERKQIFQCFETLTIILFFMQHNVKVYLRSSMKVSDVTVDPLSDYGVKTI